MKQLMKVKGDHSAKLARGQGVGCDSLGSFHVRLVSAWFRLLEDGT